MKILSVRLHNLNSLKGEHLIRFDSEPLASAGLFAITGPTGAGKTTLLDAITLALYGKVARYGNESNPEHVMTRHCGECSAEVEFEVASGVYRAAWERHRAGKKPEGKLQPSKRYIYDSAGEPLAQQIREAEQKIEDLLGLNYDRFLRSVLLAQGDFARFLKADANERAELLESLTGTTIYSSLGKLAHEEANRRGAALDAKRAGLDQIQLLTPEERSELTDSIKRGESELKNTTTELTKGAEMLEGIRQLQAARAKEESAKTAQTNLLAEKKAAAPKLAKLKSHLATRPFAKLLSELEHAEASHREALEKSRQATETHQSQLARRSESGSLFHSSLQQALTETKTAGTEAQNVAKQAAEESARARQWLKENAADATLADSLADIVSAIGETRNLRESLAQSWSDWAKSAARVSPDESSDLPSSISGIAEQNLASLIQTILQAGKGRLNQLKESGQEARRQLNLRKDHLEKSKLVASLEQHRANLKPGESCPLCGSTDHPFAGDQPVDATFSKLETEVATAEANLEKAIDEYRTLENERSQLETRGNELLATRRQCEVASNRLSTLLESIHTTMPEPGQEVALQNSLQKRVKHYRSHESLVETGARKQAEAESNAKQATEELRRLSQKAEKLAAYDVEKDKIATATVISVDKAEESFLEAVQQEKVAASQAEARQKDETTLSQKKNAANKALTKALANSDFTSLAALREAHLPETEAETLESLQTHLNEQAAAAQALLEQASKEVTALVSKQILEGREAELFVSEQTKLSHSRDTLLEAQTTRKNTLSSDETNRKRKEESEKELEEDKKEFQIWRRLKELIGSHDGAKFRRHAQSISLDILTRHANRHLVKLSDRYRIRRDETGELNLEIEDLHQAGAKRPMASLSGGESFLASLALALGLSDLAGRTVRIDSLFIDEGFGSLDPDSLEIAIGTLESLQQDHKTVGVISHVDLLKERIGTQIIVEKHPGGVSEIRIVPQVDD